MTDAIVTEIAESVLTIRLNRPDQLNSLTREMKVGLRDALDAAAADPSIRAVVFTGTGRALSAGQDIGEMLEFSDAAQIEAEVNDYYAPIIMCITAMPKPVIAAVNGTVVGAALAIILACDLRVAAASARFATGFAGIGLSCDTGLSWTLPRVVGRGAALDLLLRPRMIDSAEALHLGLVGEVAPDEGFAEHVSRVAATIASGPTLAFASMKAAVQFASTSTLGEALAFEARLMAVTGASADFRAARDAFLAKQTPVFTGA